MQEKCESPDGIAKSGRFPRLGGSVYSMRTGMTLATSLGTEPS